MAQLEDYIDLSRFPNITPEKKRALTEFMNGATDASMKQWFRTFCEYMFELEISDAERIEEVIQQAKMSGLRQAEYEGDEVGRWDD